MTNPEEKLARRKFSKQKSDATRNRGIEWNLTFDQWWDWWQKSGHWNERGKAPYYCMCRNGDLGPYELGNIFCAPSSTNVTDALSDRMVSVITPLGTFNSAAEAARAHNTNRWQILVWARSHKHGMSIKNI